MEEYGDDLTPMTPEGDEEVDSVNDMFGQMFGDSVDAITADDILASKRAAVLTAEQRPQSSSSASSTSTSSASSSSASAINSSKSQQDAEEFAILNYLNNPKYKFNHPLRRTTNIVGLENQ